MTDPNPHAATVETADERIATDGTMVKLWLDALKAAEKEEEHWRKDGDEAIQVYRAEKDADPKGTAFNILHSNVETIIPAVYNSTPVPDIRMRFDDGQQAAPAAPVPGALPAGPVPGMAPSGGGAPVGGAPAPQAPPAVPESARPEKQVATALERVISHQIDAYDFDGDVRAAIFDMQVPGRGVMRVRYRPYMADDNQSVAYEEVTCEYVPWKAFRRGPGRIWRDVAWIAFQHFFTRQELRELAIEDDGTPRVDAKSGKPLGDEIQLTATVDGGKQDDKAEPDESDIFKRAEVWEIWDREQRAVYFIAPSYETDVVRALRDPLELEGFFPIPRPLQKIVAPYKLVPVVPYTVYRPLAEELNDITQRITRLVRQMRVKGAFAGAADEMKQLADADDGELIGVNGDMMKAGGLDALITWWPIEPQAKALAQLLEQRERVKQTIYEVTGISDIVRGASMASETATAQQIKQQWGSLRIQRDQAEIQRFIRDLFRLKAEIIAAKFSPTTIRLMTGIELSPEAEQLMRSDLLRSYKIDVESDSTIRADLTRNQQTMTEFLTGTAGYIQAVGPAVMSKLMPASAAVAIFAAFARNFKLGREVEDVLGKMVEQAKANEANPPPEKPDPETMKVQADQQRLQMEGQMKMADAQMRQQEAQAALELKRQEAEHAMSIKEREFEMKRAEMEMTLAFKREEAALKVQAAEAATATKMHAAEMDAEMKTRTHEMQLEHADEAHRAEMARAAEAETETADE